uniref:Uncharacterized protein n=1 Tax=Arundo donax TaxID=35708 RepID=A0A0A9ADG0_ARUDO
MRRIRAVLVPKLAFSGCNFSPFQVPRAALQSFLSQVSVLRSNTRCILLLWI